MASRMPLLIRSTAYLADSAAYSADSAYLAADSAYSFASRADFSASSTINFNDFLNALSHAAASNTRASQTIFPYRAANAGHAASVPLSSIQGVSSASQSGISQEGQAVVCSASATSGD